MKNFNFWRGWYCHVNGYMQSVLTLANSPIINKLENEFALFYSHAIHLLFPNQSAFVIEVPDSGKRFFILEEFSRLF